jgi:RimJ/RimL family protein N-acetyltransferase
MTWFLTEDPDEYLAAAGAFLTSDPVANTTLLVVAERLRSEGGNASGRRAPGRSAPAAPDRAPLLGWWRPAGATIAGAFLHTPPYPVVLTSMAPAAASALAATLAARGRPVAGLAAEQAAGNAFVTAWRDRTGDQSWVRMCSRLYRLGTLSWPQPQPPGRARVAAPADLDLLIAWHEAFHQETLSGPRDVTAIVNERLSYGGLTLWEAGQAAVSMAGVTRLLAGHVRVAPVYTPPQLRGHGYAAAVTSAVSQAALDAGARDVVLFTDLANATSNALYQRIGYRPVADRVEWSFGPPRHGRTAEGT